MKRKLFLILFILLLAGCASYPPITRTEPIDTGIDPAAWALIPAGEFNYGRHNEKILLDYDFEMMVTPVTNAQYADFLNQELAGGGLKITGEQVMVYYPGEPFQGVKHEEKIEAGDWPVLTLNAPATHLTYADGAFTPQPGFENHPVVGVSWFGANAYCQEFGWRLPGEVEWERAARGDDERSYPWGDTIASNQANYYNSRDLFEKIMGKQGDTTPVGYYNGSTYPDGYATLNGASPYGLYDMAGNVWQWMGDDYAGVHYRYLRGGSKADYAYNLRVYSRNNATPQTESIHFGFRCAREVNP